MRTSEFLEQLRALSIVVSAEGGALKVSAPKGALTPELKRELGERKEELLTLLSAARAGPGALESDPVAAQRIPRAPRGGPLPLSATQQRLWFLDQMEPGLVTYNMWNTCTLAGPLDRGALERALREIVRRHDVLRTAFRDSAGIPEQVVAPEVEFALERLPGGQTDDELRDELWARLEVPFDLSRAPLLRMALVERSADEHVLFVVVHHIVFDGLSWGLFFRELKVLYEDLVAGRPCSLPALEIQYADFAVWQAEYFKGAEFERQRRYWLETLGGRLPLLELGTDRPRPALQTYNGGVERHWSPRSLSAALENLAKREGATLFLVMLAAYEVFLQRYTGQTDLLVGTAMGNRNRAEVEDLMGFFVNTLVLRTSLADDPTFLELVGRVRDTFLGALEHQDMPFERLVDELQPERNLSYSPIFQTLFVLDQDSGHSRTMADVELKPFVLDNHATRTDLVITAYNGRDGLTVAVEYNTDLFDAATIDRMLSHYEVVLEAVAADPALRISELPIQTPAEVEQLLSGWNETAAEFPKTPVFQQIEQQTDRTPEALALVFPALVGGEDERLTYQELDRRANRLAHHLVARGVQPDTLVGLCLERSVDLLVGDLAIQKAGAAYVPLDPAFPRDRLTYMVADSGLSIVVTSGELEGLLEGAEVRAVRVDAEAGEIAARPSTRLDLDVPVTARMYVIYTSGSTGRPKGVELEHRSVSNFLATMAREPGLTADDAWLAVTTLSFDISVYELMCPLVVGGTVILAPKEATGDGESLLGLMERLSPTVMQATPATWRMLLLAGWQGDPDEVGGLRIFCGGEALPRELGTELLAFGREVWNLYGPTEATIWSTIWRVRAEGPVLIGAPIGNTQVYVLDAGNAPVPVGVTGELWIAGDGLARGYLERPELTAERFVPNPFRQGERMYRTGDLARWKSSGELECLGRVDSQVKLRGFRIELGEIESVVAEHPQVTQCAAVVREDTPGDQRLVAYYVGGEPSLESLRARAREQLPAYMVPSSFVALDEIPLTPNGKVDRLALLAMKANTTVSEEEYVAPRNELEERIAAAWGEALGVEQVPIHTNFFDLGGHSLLLAQVRVKLEETLERNVSIIELFQYPTVSGLAGHLGAASTQGREPRRRERDLSAGRKKLASRRRARR